MDKSWMNKGRNTLEYLRGLEKFLDFAFLNPTRSGMIFCPCKECKLTICVRRSDAREHLTVMGFIKDYDQWIAHGECASSRESRSFRSIETTICNDNDDMHGLVNDAFGIPHNDIDEDNSMGSNGNEELPNGNAGKFYKLIDDSQKSLYEGCEKFSKLSFIIRLLHIKCEGKWSNKHFDMLLDLLSEAFPQAFNDMPKSYYECEKVMKDLGVGYEKIDACKKDCIIYWGVNAGRTSCPTCNRLRWKTSTLDPTGEKRKIAEKVFWYFPIKPRLQRLYMSCKTATHMRWHDEQRTKDGYMRHPADSPAWQTFDKKYPEFGNESRNVRLGLAADGFNPFGDTNVRHSTWPVVLIPYNLPPWMGMKEQHFLLSILIPGRKAPGNNIDVYMQPLISDLKDLWEVGIETYDASRKQHFQLRASLLWTISDFPGYANLSGWSTKGKYACPVCHEFTQSCWLKNGGKHCYMGHRRFLARDHAFRKSARVFDGKEEHGRPPQRLTGDRVLHTLKDANIIFGKKVKGNPKLPFSWKKRSIFFDLPYWKDNLIRHNLDVMHTEKNVCDSIISTLLGVNMKTKDNLKSRLDLKEMGIRPELHPIHTESGRVFIPPACYKMSNQEKSMFSTVLGNVKVPDGYSANISRCIKKKPCKLIGLKSHDYHILMQQLLPVALRKTLPKSVRMPLLRLSKFFRELCSKVIYPPDVIRLEKEIAVTLCQLEKIFPPSFFDVMVHITVHLATEVRLGGPVQYRWMYPIERYLGTLKSYVRNRSKAEGSIVQGYVAAECLSFCSLYLTDYVETKFNKRTRNDAINESLSLGLKVFNCRGLAIGEGKPVRLDASTLKKAHQYILFNCDAVTPYIEKHLSFVQQRNPRLPRHQIERIHSEEFADWFSDHVQNMVIPEGDPVMTDLKWLSKGPNDVGVRFKKYVVNGFRFHTKEVERTRTTQNCGVSVKATTSSFASTRDENPVVGDLEYYGVLTDIIEMDYVGRNVVLFDCEWVSKGSRLKEDIDGFKLANFTNVRRHNEPFILASQATQVFYIQDPMERDWQVVISTTARGVYNMEPMADVETFLQSNLGSPLNENDAEEVLWVREDIDGDHIDNVH